MNYQVKSPGRTALPRLEITDRILCLSGFTLSVVEGWVIQNLPGKSRGKEDLNRTPGVRLGLEK